MSNFGRRAPIRPCGSPRGGASERASSAGGQPTRGPRCPRQYLDPHVDITPHAPRMRGFCVRHDCTCIVPNAAVESITQCGGNGKDQGSVGAHMRATLFMFGTIALARQAGAWEDMITMQTKTKTGLTNSGTKCVEFGANIPRGFLDVGDVFVIVGKARCAVCRFNGDTVPATLLGQTSTLDAAEELAYAAA